MAAGRLLKFGTRPYDTAELRAVSEGLAAQYQQAAERMIAELGRANLTSWGAAFRKQQLDQIREILLGLNEATRAWAQENLPTLYARGLWVAEHSLQPGGLSVAAHPGQVTPMDLTMTKMDERVIQALAEELILPLDKANTQAAQYTEDMVARARVISRLASEGADMTDVDGILAQARKLVGTGGYEGAFAKQLQIRDATLKTMVQAFAQGKTDRQAVRALLGNLRQRGITSFIDKSGRPWNMVDYSRMVVRTVARRTQTAATRMRTVQYGHDLVKIIDHDRECPLCRPWEGKVLSITGQTKGYPTVAMAEAAGYGHPNCSHAEAPWVT